MKSLPTFEANKSGICVDLARHGCTGHRSMLLHVLAWVPSGGVATAAATGAAAAAACYQGSRSPVRLPRDSRRAPGKERSERGRRPDSRGGSD